jgi:hypothetical protein
MKKGLSILFAILILLSGMNFSIATHFCGGKIAAVKWSFSGKNASCGMEDTKGSCPTPIGIASRCCHNEISVLKVDKDYSTSSFQINEPVRVNLHMLFVSVNVSYNLLFAEKAFYEDTGPPDNFLVSDVSLAKVCVFQI